MNSRSFNNITSKIFAYESYIYIYIYIYIYLQEKPEFGQFRIMNLFPSIIILT